MENKVIVLLCVDILTHRDRVKILAILRLRSGHALHGANVNSVDLSAVLVKRLMRHCVYY